ncbi:MAG: molecular chaperone DnaJ [Puniceicoccales bacterium]|jgi:molecular chaperone DnaJ|nr:molecular chaperone DnaJ [Puniceicoccales bacterium]
MSDDYYKLLEIERSANADEIKKAYRKQAMKWHPDRNPGDKNAEENFKKVSHAYEILSDAQKRATYDQYGAAAFEGAAGGRGGSAGFHDPMDIFRQFFGGAARGGSIFSDLFGGGEADTGPAQGEHLRFDLQISLEEAATGTEKRIKYRRHVTCPNCQGTGAEPGSKRRTCPDCQGKGQTIHSSGFFAIRQPCPKCRGEGEIIEKPCKQCHAEGRIIQENTVTVKVPPGADTGLRLRSNGNGSAGIKGGPNGHLYLEIHVTEHDLYEREGDDLHCIVPIKFTLAALGGSVEVPTLKGRAALKIPTGTANGTVFRLRDKGIPSLHTGTPGDLLVRVEIDVPKKMTDEQRRKLEEFARASNDDVHPVPESWSEKFKRFFGHSS